MSRNRPGIADAERRSPGRTCANVIEHAALSPVAALRNEEREVALGEVVECHLRAALGAGHRRGLELGEPGGVGDGIDRGATPRGRRHRTRRARRTRSPRALPRVAMIMLSWWMIGSATRRSSIAMPACCAAACMRIQSRTPSELMNVTPARSRTSRPPCARAEQLDAAPRSRRSRRRAPAGRRPGVDGHAAAGLGHDALHEHVVRRSRRCARSADSGHRSAR